MAKRQNLRRHDRASSAAKVELGWGGETGCLKSTISACRDVSPGGFRVVTRDAIPMHSRVQFRFVSANFRGSASVRAVRTVREGYEIGLEFSGMEQTELMRLKLLAPAAAAS